MTTLLTAKVVQSYGLKDSEQCEDVARALNGMLGFVEKTRGESLGKFYAGVVLMVDEIKRLQADIAQLSSEKKDLLASVQTLNEFKEQVAGLSSLNDKMNARIKELMATNKELVATNSELETFKQKASKAEADLKAERSKIQKLSSENQKMINDAARKNDSKITGKADSSSSSSKGSILVSLADKDKIDDIVIVNQRLTAENARLNSLISSLTASMDIPESVPKDDRRTRFNQEDVAKMRGVIADQARKIEAIIADEKRFAIQSSEQLAANDAKWRAEVQKLEATIEAREKELQTLRSSAPSKRNAQLEQTLMSDLSAQVSSGRSKSFLSTFALTDRTLMACPVPTRTGVLIQLRDVYAQWMKSPCDNEGSFYATFTCPYTSQITSLASPEQVHLISQIAQDLDLSMNVPLRFQYLDRGIWVDFLLFDQILIASACCKLYRSAKKDGTEEALVCRNMFVFVIRLNDSVADFQLHSFHDVGDIRPACLLPQVDVRGQSYSFFERWKYAPLVGDVAMSGA